MNYSSQKRSKDTEKSIKKVALSYISKYSYETITLKDIAQTIGIKTPSIYAHFNSKKQIFIYALKEAKEQEREKLLKLVLSFRTKTAEEVIRNFFYYYTDINNIVFWKIILKQSLGNLPSDLLQILKEDFTKFEKEISIQLKYFFQIGQEEGWILRKDIDQMVSLFFTLIDGLLSEQNLYKTTVYNKRRDNIWELYKQIITYKNNIESINKV